MIQSVRRLAAFAWEMAPPKIYLTYAVLWVLGLRSAMALGRGDEQLALTLAVAVDIATVALLLFYIRAVDEQKDYEYDRVHNPTRPLIRGSVTANDLRAGMLVAVVATIALNAARSWLPVLAVLAVLIYALLLVLFERVSRLMRDNLFVNLAVTYPVQILMMGYLFASYREDTGASIDWVAVPVGLIFVCAFLHFEFARKTAWDQRPGESFYSNLLGPLRSGVVTAVLAVAAMAIAVVVARPWQLDPPPALAALLPVIACVFLVKGAREFAQHSVAVWPRADAMQFLASLYLIIFLEVCLVLSLQLGT